jgi:hypothetical protein
MCGLGARSAVKAYWRGFPTAVGGGLRGGGHQNRSSGIEHAFATVGMYRLHGKRHPRAWEAAGFVVCLLSAAANTYQTAGESGSLRVRLLVDPWTP